MPKFHASIIRTLAQHAAIFSTLLDHPCSEISLKVKDNSCAWICKASDSCMSCGPALIRVYLVRSIKTTEELKQFLDITDTGIMYPEVLRNTLSVSLCFLIIL